MASTPEPAIISGGAKGAKLPASAEDVQTLQAPVVAAATEGGYTVWGTVVDTETGEALLDTAVTTPHTPALTTRTLVAFSTPRHLNPTATLTTSALLGADNQTLYLDSEDDLLLGIGTSDEVEISGRAGLQILAKDTAAALTQHGVTPAALNWRGSLFEGASHLSSWDAQEVGSYKDHVGPMAIDARRTYEGANAFYSDVPGRVAEVFSQALSAEGISATLDEAGNPPVGAEAVAQVSSVTMGKQLRWMLARSGNILTDQYCRFAARAAGAPSTYDGATETMRKTLTEAGVFTGGLTLKDYSGLSSDDKISAYTLVDILKASYESMDTEADTMRLPPQTGLVGTLSKRMTEEFATGNVQAKTDALQEVASLSGSVMTKNGRALLMSIDHDNVTEGVYATRDHLDAFEEGLVRLD